MNKKILYVDCTSLLFEKFHTGIERVEVNFIKNADVVNKDDNYTVKQIVLLKNKFVEINLFEKNLKTYLTDIFLHLLFPNKFRSLCVAAFPFLKKRINNNWYGIKKFILISLFSFLSIFPIIFSIIGYYSKFLNFVKLREEDIYFLIGSWWLPLYNFIASAEMRQNRSMFVVFVHDVLPITHHQLFLNHKQFYDRFFEIIKCANLVITSSSTTLMEIRSLLERQHKYQLLIEKYFACCPLGFDFSRFDSQNIIRSDVLEIFANSSPYITVGTVEPRKNHAFLLDVFERLWSVDKNIRLCIIGRYGWKAEEVAVKIKLHPAYGKSLFWLQDLSDRELRYCYTQARAMIYPSVAEGFGLPLVEALSLGCDVFATDIPVFREIGGNHCYYFCPGDLDELVKTIENYEVTGKMPGVDNSIPFSWVSWRESVQDIFLTIKSQHELSMNNRIANN